MCSTRRPVALNPCASVKLVPHKPIRPTKMQCWMHPRRATCRLQHVRNAYHDELNESALLHMTVYSDIFLDERARPYYRRMLRARTDAAAGRRAFLNAGQVHDCLLIAPMPDEHFKSIEEAGETNMNTLRTILATLTNFLSRVTRNEYLLIVDRLFIDLVYSEFRAVVLPQHAYVLQQACAPSPLDGESSEEEQCERRVESPWDQIVTTSYVATANRDGDVLYNEWQRQSQYIYQTFLLYSTMLTAILKQSNPFIISESSSASVILRTLGSCPDNPDRVNLCKLSYGGAPPGHIMCAPRAIVKKVYRYVNWALNPHKDQRYSALIARPSDATTTGGCTGDLRENINNDLHADDVTPLILLDWDNFITAFMDYFGAPPSARSAGI
ncbi:VP1054 [Dione juno nucleopolyhedrovirus]|uniref:VP1054 n=1 Tax=Dione juno nucleopolyhedrovirus TaxID=2594175 RepID=A0AAE6H3G1_9ABAC|nr:VP1054 [Dione juno nucleopolyhedrovirus]QDL57051.1 VP1054 [Dione juno nucleopolyhedrovirus]